MTYIVGGFQYSPLMIEHSILRANSYKPPLVTYIVPFSVVTMSYQANTVPEFLMYLKPGVEKWNLWNLKSYFMMVGAVRQICSPFRNPRRMMTLQHRPLTKQSHLSVLLFAVEAGPALLWVLQNLNPLCIKLSLLRTVCCDPLGHRQELHP